MIENHNDSSFYLEEEYFYDDSFNQTSRIVTKRKSFKEKIVLLVAFSLALFTFAMTTASSVALLNNKNSSHIVSADDDDNDSLKDAAGDEYSGDEGFEKGLNDLDSINKNNLDQYRESFQYAIFYTLGANYLNYAKDPTIAGSDEAYQEYGLYDGKYNCSPNAEKFKGGKGGDDPTVKGSMLAHNCDVPTLMTEFMQKLGSMFLPSGIQGGDLDSAETSALWFGFPKGAMQELLKNEPTGKIPVGSALEKSPNKYTALELFGYNLKYTSYAGEWDHVEVMTEARALSNFGFMDNFRLAFNSIAQGIAAGVSTAVTTFLNDLKSVFTINSVGDVFAAPFKLAGAIVHSIFGGLFSSGATVVATIVDTSNTNVFVTHSWYRPDFSRTLYSSETADGSKVRELSSKERSNILTQWMIYIISQVLPDVIKGMPDDWPGHRIGSEDAKNNNGKNYPDMMMPDNLIEHPKNQTCKATLKATPAPGVTKEYDFLEDESKYGVEGRYPDKYYSDSGPITFTQADCEKLAKEQAEKVRKELQDQFDKEAQDQNAANQAAYDEAHSSWEDSKDEDGNTNSPEPTKPEEVKPKQAKVEIEYADDNAPDTLEEWLAKTGLNPGGELYNQLNKYKFQCKTDVQLKDNTEPWDMVDAVFKCYDDAAGPLLEEANAKINAQGDKWVKDLQEGAIKNIIMSSPYVNFASPIARYICDSSPESGPATSDQLTHLALQAMEFLPPDDYTPVEKSSDYDSRLNYYFTPSGSVASGPCSSVITRPPIQDGLYGNGYMDEQVPNGEPTDTRREAFDPGFMDILFGYNAFSNAFSSFALGMNSFITRTSNTVLNLAFSPLFEELGLKDLIIDTIDNFGKNIFGQLAVIIVMIAGLIIIFQAGVRRQYREQIKSIVLLTLTFFFGVILYTKPELVFSFVEDIPNEIQNVAVDAIFNSGADPDPICAVQNSDISSKAEGGILSSSQNTVRIMTCENWFVFYFNPYVYSQWGTSYGNLYANGFTASGRPQSNLGSLDSSTTRNFENKNTKLVGDAGVSLGDGSETHNWALYQVSKYLSGNTTQFDPDRVPGSIDQDFYKVVDLQAGPDYYLTNPGQVVNEPGYDSTYFDYWSGGSGGDRAFSSIGAAVVSVFGMVTITLYSIDLIKVIFSMTILLLILPIMFLIGMLPIGGRSKLREYINTLIGLVIERILLAILLALMFTMLISVTRATDNFYTYLLLAMAICVLFIKYKKELIGLFKNISDKGGGFAQGIVDDPMKAITNIAPQSIKTKMYEQKAAAKGMVEGFVGGTLATGSVSAGAKQASAYKDMLKRRAVNKERRAGGSGIFDTGGQISREVQRDIAQEISSNQRVQETISDVERTIEGDPSKEDIARLLKAHKKGESLSPTQSKALFKIINAEKKERKIQIKALETARKIAANPEKRMNALDTTPWDSELWDNPLERAELIQNLMDKEVYGKKEIYDAKREGDSAKVEYAENMLRPGANNYEEYKHKRETRKLLKDKSGELIGEILEGKAFEDDIEDRKVEEVTPTNEDEEYLNNSEVYDERNNGGEGK